MLEVHSDGSSSGKVNCRQAVCDGVPVWLGPGGYAWILVRNGLPIAFGSGGGREETNNTQELLGAILGLEAAKRIWSPGEPVTLVSDSQLVLGMASGAYEPTRNFDLVARLRALAVAMDVRCRWVKGHQYKKGTDWRKYDQDVLLNFRCDQLAHDAKMKFRV